MYAHNGVAISGSEQSLQIADVGAVLTLDYAGALAAHTGDSWFGVAVAFRMLQAAGEALSRHRLWDRRDLFVISGHPGDGVRDAIEYVTRGVSRERFRIEGEPGQPGCCRRMRFAWEVRNGAAIAAVRLRDGFVPETLFALLDRRGTSLECLEDTADLAALKRRLAEQIWDEPLARLFDLNLIAAGVTGHA